jgi:hypothetical protein
MNSKNYGFNYNLKTFSSEKQGAPILLCLVEVQENLLTLVFIKCLRLGIIF